MITSQTNSKVKAVKRLQEERRFRQRERLFVVEGTRLLGELVSLHKEAQDIFYTNEWLENRANRHLINQLPGRKHQVSPAIMKIMSDVATPAGILATVPIQPHPIPDQPTFLLLLDSIRIPGNLGTLLRTAGAAGVDAVLLAPGCVDVYNPKVIRGGMGAHLRLPIQTLSWDDIQAQTAHTAVWLASADGNITYTSIDWTGPCTLLIGGEADGASVESGRLTPGRVAIPLANQTESLNAAIAAGVILFEAVRQRVG